MSRPTLRRSSGLLALATATAATMALTPAIAQSDAEPAPVAEEGQAPVMVDAELGRADSFGAGGWEISVDNAFIAPSPLRGGHSEVRVGIVMKNTSGSETVYRADGFFADPFYPRLGIVDSSGVEHPLNPGASLLASAPGSWLNGVPPEMSARWTVGFQVPTPFTDEMNLIVHSAQGTASFDLDSAVGNPPVAAPPGLATIGIGGDIPWNDQFDVATFDFGTTICGNPGSEYALQILAVGFEVGNRTAFDADWPGVRFPDTLAVAQWADGASARFAFETYSGNSDPLLKWAEDAVRFPAGGDGATAATTHKRAMVFAVPRDSRLVETAQGPMGLWLRPPGGGPVWLELDGEGTLGLNPALCDVGNLPFTIPYAFGPGAKFVVGPDVDTADPAADDAAARDLLARAAVVAGTYKGSNDDSYSGITAAALSAIYGAIDFDAGFAASVGAVGIEQTGGVDEEAGVLMVTESASGAIVCANLNPGGFLTGGGATVEEAREVCGGQAPEEEAAPADEAAADEAAPAEETP